MKKFVYWTTLVVFCFVVSACGGGGGGESSTTTNTTTNPDPPVCVETAWTPDPSTKDLGTTFTQTSNCGTPRSAVGTKPPTNSDVVFEIKRLGFAAVPANEKNVGIVWAINETGAALIPNWQSGAQTVVDYVNTVLAKTTTKQLHIEKFKVYPDNGYDNARNDPAFYYNNGFVAGRNNYSLQGQTIFTFIYTNLSQVPNSIRGRGVTSASAGTVRIGDVYFSIDVIIENATLSSLLGKAQVDANAHSVGHWEQSLFDYLHESGHSFDLNCDEGYNYVWTDQSGVLPNLGSYNARTEYPNDPMYMEMRLAFDLPAPAVEYRFNDFNSWLIEKNANMQYDCNNIGPGVPAKVSVKVVDVNGYAVVGASVKTFGAADNDPFNGQENMQTQLEDLTTDANGMVKLTTTEFKSIAFIPYGNWIAIGIKASSNGKYAGQVLTLTDLEKAYLQQGINDYVITLKLN